MKSILFQLFYLDCFVLEFRGSEGWSGISCGAFHARSRIMFDSIFPLENVKTSETDADPVLLLLPLEKLDDNRRRMRQSSFVNFGNIAGLIGDTKQTEKMIPLDSNALPSNLHRTHSMTLTILFGLIFAHNSEQSHQKPYSP